MPSLKHASITSVSRRSFFQNLAGGHGLILGIVLSNRTQLAAHQFGGGGALAPSPVAKPNPYIHIAPGDTITFLISKAELAPGVDGSECHTDLGFVLQNPANGHLSHSNLGLDASKTQARKAGWKTPVTKIENNYALLAPEPRLVALGA
jgi:hypothetical protein